jgi:hypothetical protein
MAGYSSSPIAIWLWFNVFIFILNSLVVVQADYTACGVTSSYAFKTWVDSFETQSPLVYPTTELELKNLLKSVRSIKGCKIRVVGTAGSADGIVHQKRESNIVVVSLANLQDFAGWNGQIDTTTKRIRMNAGKTFLDLMAIARPQGYVLGTRTLHRGFTLGGVFMNPSVHGASFSYDRLCKYATGFRVMLFDGRIVELFNEKQVEAWRGSMGLLGIVLGVEIQLQSDAGMAQLVQEEDFSSTWNSSNINTFLDSIVNSHAFNAGHFFYNFWTNKIFALTAINNAAPFAYQSTDVFYAQQKLYFPELAKTGLVPLDPSSLLDYLPGFTGTPADLAATVTGITANFLQGYWQAGYNYARDGYYTDNGTIIKFNNIATLIKCQSDCIQDGLLFALLDGTKSILEEAIYYQNAEKPWYPSLLVTFRFIYVDSDPAAPKMLLENLSPGTYVAFETEDIKGLFPGGGQRAVFQRLERFWKSVNEQAAPSVHVGKEYAYSKLDCLADPYAFQDTTAISNVYATAVKKKFLQAMSQYDPRGLFRAGSALRLLGISTVTFDPRNNLGEACTDSSDCYGSDLCCCSNIPSCGYAGVLNKCVACTTSFL